MYPVRRPDTPSTQQRQKGVRPLLRSAIPRERHNYRHTQVYVRCRIIFKAMKSFIDREHCTHNEIFHKNMRISKDTSTDVIHKRNQK